MRYVFIINPVAGKGKGVQTLTPIITEYFETHKGEYKIIVTESGENARINAEREASVGDEVTIFACGGDGTFFDVLNGVKVSPNVRLGTIPCGSGNDFIKIFESTDSFLNVSSQIDGTDVPLDLIKVDDLYCMNICSLGMDAVVADRMQNFKNLPFVSGGLAYKLAIVQTFASKIGTKVKITVDGVCKGTVDTLFAVCGNGKIYGGGYKSCPDAEPDDGLLDWLIVETIPKLKAPGFLKHYEKGDYKNFPFCHYGKCKVFEIESENEEPINLDGEILHKKKVRFEILGGAVRFILPKGIAEKFLNNKKTAPVV